MFVTFFWYQFLMSVHDRNCVSALTIFRPNLLTFFQIKLLNILNLDTLIIRHSGYLNQSLNMNFRSLKTFFNDSNNQSVNSNSISRQSINGACRDFLREKVKFGDKSVPISLRVTQICLMNSLLSQRGLRSCPFLSIFDTSATQNFEKASEYSTSNAALNIYYE